MSHTLHSWWCGAGRFYNLYKMGPKQLHCSPPNIWLKQQEIRIWMFDFSQQNKFCVLSCHEMIKMEMSKNIHRCLAALMWRSSVYNVSGEWFCGWLVLFVCQNSWMVAGRKWSSNILCRNFCIFFRHSLDTLHQFKICPATSSVFLKTFKWCHINHFCFQIGAEIFWEAVEKSIPPEAHGVLTGKV